MVSVERPSVSAIARASFDSSREPPVTWNNELDPNYKFSEKQQMELK